MQNIEILKNIPQILKEQKQWVNCVDDKTPINPKTLRGASSSNKTTWGSYDQAVASIGKTATYKNGSGETLQAETLGVGFVLANGFAAVDIDDHEGEGIPESILGEFVESLNTYTEYSRSGKGYHIIGKTEKDPAKKRSKLVPFLEFYSQDRYMIMTGNVYADKPVNDFTENFMALNKKYMPADEPARRQAETGYSTNSSLEDGLKHDKVLIELWNGEQSSSDESGDDMSLMNKLAYWCNCNTESMIAAFKSSPYAAQKDEEHIKKMNRKDYLQRTAKEAVAKCRSTAEKDNAEYQASKEFSVYVESESGQEKSVEVNYIYKNERGKQAVNTGLLAQFIRENFYYMIVRKQGFDNDFLYWYENGYYKRMSANEFKGKIKNFIPTAIRKPNQWEETYKELITDKASVRFEDIDTDSKYINLKNGLYNIETGCLEEHNPEIKSTLQLNCSYSKDAAYPAEWMKFIRMFADDDENIMGILQEWFGLTISSVKGSITKKCMALWGIRGNTGKTQYENMMIHLLGSENICSTAIQDFSKTFGTGDIYGASAIIIDDQTAANIADSSTFKSITGGGFIRCEIKGKQSFPYEFRGTLTFGCNDLPYFKGDKGDHLFERFIIIPCDNVIPEAERVGDILERFKPESDGIFLWALEGLRKLKDNGYKFTHSAKCQTALEEYRCANDSLYSFIQENYIITGNRKDRIKKTILENEYQAWCFRSEKQALEKKNIADRALKHGISAVKSSGDHYYQGIDLKVF